MQKLELKAEKREVFGKKLGKIRKTGKLPVVLYGSKQENTSFFVDFNDFRRVWKKVGETTVIGLISPTGPINALIYDVQLDPITNEPRHADFYAVDMTKKIIAGIPLNFTGEAPAIKLGGTLVKVLYEIEVESLPGNLPHELVVNIEGLKNFEDKILVKDIKAPEGVEFKIAPEETVAFVEEMKEEETPAEERTIADIEVTTEKKAEEEAGEDADLTQKEK